MNVNTDNINDITLEDVTSYAMKNADAIIVADGRADTYRALARRGLFAKLLDADGSYLDLIEKLWYHFNNSSDTVIEDYRVFIPTAGKFVGKYSRRINISFNSEYLSFLNVCGPDKGYHQQHKYHGAV